MYKKIFLFAMALFIFNIGYAQEEQAKENTTSIGGEGNLSFANTSFGDYFSGGGLGSTTINGILNTYLNKAYTNGSNWDNLLRIDYGVARVENTNDDQFSKTSDVLDFVSKYGTPLKNSDKWFYSAAFNVLSQLTDTNTAFDESNNNFVDLIGVDQQPIYGQVQSTFLSPADISLGLGLDYKPNDNFTAFVGPLAAKLRTIANDDIARSGLYGNDVTIENGLVTDYENNRFEAGASVIGNYNTKLLTDDMLSFSSGIRLFSNYLEDPQNVDVNWNTLTSLNPWKFISITYSTDLAYDDNKSFTNFANGQSTGGVDQGVQFRHVLGLGLIHKFGDSKE